MPFHHCSEIPRFLYIPVTDDMFEEIGLECSILSSCHGTAYPFSDRGTLDDRYGVVHKPKHVIRKQYLLYARSNSKYCGSSRQAWEKVFIIAAAVFETIQGIRQFGGSYGVDVWNKNTTFRELIKPGKLVYMLLRVSLRKGIIRTRLFREKPRFIARRRTIRRTVKRSTTDRTNLASYTTARNESPRLSAFGIRLASFDVVKADSSVAVTPVRDETGQLPLYILFFRRDEGGAPTFDAFTKRSSLRARFQLKPFRSNRGSKDLPKRPRNTGPECRQFSYFTLITSQGSLLVENLSNQQERYCGSSGYQADPESVAILCTLILTSLRCFLTSDNWLYSNLPLLIIWVAEVSDNLADVPSSSVEGSSTDSSGEKPVPQHDRKSGVLRPATRRPLSLLTSHKPKAPDSESEHDISPHQATQTGDCSPTRRRPATWYHSRAGSADSLVINHSSGAQKRTGAYGNLAESEALRLVLSSHPEPTKASVTEKFAQFLSMDEDLHVEHRFQSPHMHKFTLKHYSMFKAIWDWIILVMIIYTAIATPFVTVFLTNKYSNKYSQITSVEKTDADNFHLLGIEILVDIMFLVDILINFRTTYVNKNDEVVSHPRRIATHYLKGWFFVDLVAAIPFDLVFINLKDKVTTLLKSARLLRLFGIVRKLDRYSEYGASILLLLTALFALIAHWLACIWYAIGKEEHRGEGPKIGWLNTLAMQTEQHYTEDPNSGPDIQTKYITALYFTFSSLTSIGFGNVSPNTNAEKVFSIVVMLVGSLMYASIFGNVGALIQRLYSGTARYHAQMLRIKEFIRFHQIPSPLRQRLEEYSTQVWEHTNGIDMTMVQYSFPESLQSDICLYVYRDFLGGSSAFRSLNDGCLRNISLRIRAAHMPPSDTLIHTGDLLTAIYFVVKGSLEVVTTDDLILGVLNPGDFFATLGMAPPPKSRFAVRALTYADVQFIDRHDLTDLCHVYPELAHRLLERFELTIPLVSPSLNLPQPLKSVSPWFGYKSNVERFLKANSVWNPVSKEILPTLVTLINQRRRPSIPTQTDDLFNSARPAWELERLQRLFDHGTLCTNAAEDSTAPDVQPTIPTFMRSPTRPFPSVNAAEITPSDKRYPSSLENAYSYSMMSTVSREAAWWRCFSSVVKTVIDTYDTAMLQKPLSNFAFNIAKTTPKQPPVVAYSNGEKPPSACWQCGEWHFVRFLSVCNRRGHKKSQCRTRKASQSCSQTRRSRYRRSQSEPRFNAMLARFDNQIDAGRNCNFRRKQYYLNCCLGSPKIWISSRPFSLISSSNFIGSGSRNVTRRMIVQTYQLIVERPEQIEKPELNNGSSTVVPN
ncbi:potassium voltage-gated channel subfamily H member 7 [Clonorchis sinensis]|uniref:Potassium voltage-gated channel subfamily H member 7 n=1 Tax=Clonorchis sinensis TaxID=79923 RepID=G7YAN1_CLOSI|nr:potassium voltage-gated channel subfamily H member 7 [Clonorchis sinensis]